MCPTDEYLYHQGKCYYEGSEQTGETYASNCPGTGAKLPADMDFDDNVFLRGTYARA